MKTLLRALVVLVALLCSTSVEAAVAHVATLKISDNTAGTAANGSSVTPSTGDLLLVGIMAYRSAGAFTITASWNGNAMTEDKTTTAIAGNAVSVFRTSLFSLPNVTSATAATALTFSASVDFCTIFTVRVSGAATSSITDGTGGAGNTGTGGATSISTGAMSSTNSDDFWVTLIGSDSGANPASLAAAGWTIPTNGSELNGAANVVAGIAYIANPGATSETGAWTASNSVLATVGMAYKAAGGAATPGCKNGLLLYGVGCELTP